MKIALVKQEVYQDLYVCPVTEKNAANILFSSMGRVGNTDLPQSNTTYLQTSVSAQD